MNQSRSNIESSKYDCKKHLRIQLNGYGHDNWFICSNNQCEDISNTRFVISNYLHIAGGLAIPVSIKE